MKKYKNKVTVILGTRPEAIKLAPVILRLKEDVNFSCELISTGQHREMLDQVFDVFDIKPDIDFQLMTPNQSLSSLTARCISLLGEYFSKSKPDITIVQGDTASAFCGALVSYYHKIPVAHVEAGLRTDNIYSPWPEEINRQLISRIAELHFCPTNVNKTNLISENIDSTKVFVTGNTVIDALKMCLDNTKKLEADIKGLPGNTLEFIGNRRMILVTCHRRENFGNGIENIFKAIIELAKKFPEIYFIMPVHLNPNIRNVIYDLMKKESEQKSSLENLFLIEPQSYLPFTKLIQQSYLILTDSGGIQEEAPGLGKPVLVLRDTTERNEGVEAGTTLLVGTEKNTIVEITSRLLENKDIYDRMSNAVNPYGDGTSADQIIRILYEWNNQ